MSNTLKVPAEYYQQFDADYSLEIPAEGYGGWKEAELEISLEHTAVAVMHAWHPYTRAEFPGVYRAVEYIPRSAEIMARVFPPLLTAVRASPLPLFHVVGGRPYQQNYPGYRRAVAMAQPDAPLPAMPTDPVLDRLLRFRAEHVFVGTANNEDAARAAAARDFAPQALPQGDEGIAENAAQLFALCREKGINHLIYAGFAIDGCLLLSPGGMVDMSRRGIMCSAFRQAVTAIENKESAREEWAKQIALWRVAVLFGFVFDVDGFIGALGKGQAA